MILFGSRLLPLAACSRESLREGTRPQTPVPVDPHPKSTIRHFYQSTLLSITWAQQALVPKNKLLMRNCFDTRGTGAGGRKEGKWFCTVGMPVVWLQRVRSILDRLRFGGYNCFIARSIHVCRRRDRQRQPAPAAGACEAGDNLASARRCALSSNRIDCLCFVCPAALNH